MRTIVEWLRTFVWTLPCRLGRHTWDSYADGESGYEDVHCSRCGYEAHRGFMTGN